MIQLMTDAYIKFSGLNRTTKNIMSNVLGEMEKAGMSHEGHFARKLGYPKYWYSDEWEPEVSENENENEMRSEDVRTSKPWV